MHGLYRTIAQLYMEYPLLYMGIWDGVMDYEPLTKWDAHPSRHFFHSLSIRWRSNIRDRVPNGLLGGVTTSRYIGYT